MKRNKPINFNKNTGNQDQDHVEIDLNEFLDQDNRPSTSGMYEEKLHKKGSESSSIRISGIGSTSFNEIAQRKHNNPPTNEKGLRHYVSINIGNSPNKTSTSQFPENRPIDPNKNFPNLNRTEANPSSSTTDSDELKGLLPYSYADLRLNLKSNSSLSTVNTTLDPSKSKSESNIYKTSHFNVSSQFLSDDQNTPPSFDSVSFNQHIDIMSGSPPPKDTEVPNKCSINFILYNLVHFLFIGFHLSHLYYVFTHFFSIDLSVHICVVLGCICGYCQWKQDTPYRRDLKAKDIILSRLMVIIYYLLPILVAVAGYKFVREHSISNIEILQNNDTYTYLDAENQQNYGN